MTRERRPGSKSEAAQSDPATNLTLAASVEPWADIGAIEPFDIYLRQINTMALLDAAQEVTLAKRIEAGVLAEERLGQDGRLSVRDRTDLEALRLDGIAAKQAFIHGNLRLVVHVARRFMGQGCGLADLTQEGNLGLIRAVEKFDYTKGLKLSTYAVWWIRSYIQSAIVSRGHTIRLPADVAADAQRMRRARERLVDAMGREPTVVELSNACGLSPERQAEARALAVPMVSLDQWSAHNDDDENRGGWPVWDRVFFRPLADRVIEGLGSHEPTATPQHEELTRALGTLPERSAEILRLRAGYRSSIPMTLEEIGQGLGITRERVRQIEQQSLRELAGFMRRAADGEESLKVSNDA